MRKATLGIIIILVIIGNACGSTEPAQPQAQQEAATAAPEPTNEPTPVTDRLALLHDASLALGTTIAEKDWATLYLSHPEEYRAKCPAPDFLKMWTFIEVFGEMPDGLTFTLHRVWIEGDLGYGDGEWDKDGVIWGEDAGEDRDPLFEWVDGAWVMYISPEEMAKENPCEITFDDEEPTAVPEATGKTLDDAVPLGGEAVSANGVVIQVLGTIPNATSVVLSENMFNPTPTPGDRYYIVTVRLTNNSKETKTFTQIDFSLIGERRAQYHDIFGCGLGGIPDALDDGEVWPGGYIEGNVCFKVPEDEGGFVLMYDPDLFGNSNRTFLQVE